jgi:hypothetical protein
MPLHEWIAFNSPLARPWHQLGLELVVGAAFALTLHHVLRCYRSGDRYPLFQWLVILAYGILLELIAFNFYQNYDHAQFTVQLYHRKLPLYVPAVYIVFHYAGLKTIERLRYGFVVEALLVGFAICLLDVPFDITGVQAGWWTWSASDPRLAYRWLGVPVTSYYWYLTFGAVFAALCRFLRPRLAARSLVTYALVAPLVAVAVIVLGPVAFLPFHGLHALGLSEGAIVAAHLTAVAALLLFARTAATVRAAWQVTAIAVALYAWHLGLLAWRWSTGQAAHPLLDLALFLLAAFGVLHKSFRAAAPDAARRIRPNEIRINVGS